MSDQQYDCGDMNLAYAGQRIAELEKEKKEAINLAKDILGIHRMFCKASYGSNGGEVARAFEDKIKAMS